MSGRIPQHFIDELLSRADLVELIGTRVPLKKAGKEFKACCPFHGEKTPSFSVVPDKQFYHCFGCGAHGTALTFLMDHDHLTFIEAIEDLAERVGLTVPRESSQSLPPKPNEDLFTLVQRASDLYQKELGQSDRAKTYLKKRGLSSETAALFGIGYAPDGWDFVLKHLGASEGERTRLFQVGLIIERERRPSTPPGHYDRFRDRIMFPIRDARGRSIGFGGRVLDQGEPKYLNSPETELFHKGRELYGLFEARKATRTLERLLVVEGYMDVVRLHQAGVTYAVATLGTATTPEHLTRIFRIVSEVVFCFDGDRAGRQAAWRALENALEFAREGRQIRFLFLPEGHDPDSLVGAEGREAFEGRLAGALPLSDYLIQHLGEQVDLQSIDGRARFAELARPMLARIPHGVYRELLVDAVAAAVRMEPSRLANVLGVEVEPPRPQEEHSGSVFKTSAGMASAGRWNLVRQAIHLIVHFPQSAQEIDAQGLNGNSRPGISLLVDLLSELAAHPCQTTGMLLERWRGRPFAEELAKLATRECLVGSAAAASTELGEAVRLLQEEVRNQRRDALLSKHGSKGLSDPEKLELQALLQGKGPHSGALERDRT